MDKVTIEKEIKQRVHHGDEDEILVEGDVKRKSRRSSLSALSYYQVYHGHDVEDLDMVLNSIRPAPSKKQERSVVFLAGDSSLDNKFWFGPISSTCKSPAVNGYESILKPPLSVPDVCYWLNHSCKTNGFGDDFVCLNTAIEESTLADRAGLYLLPQDLFIQKNITENDYLVISVGGNDIALRPSCGTIASMLSLVLSPLGLIESGYALGLGHFITMFNTDIKNYIEKLVKIKKPKAVVVCMIYYPDETAGNSWAETVLASLGYNSDPNKLQSIIRKVYTEAVCQIKVEGTKIIPFPLFEVLDGKVTEDYTQRVEPSIKGGKKMGYALLETIVKDAEVKIALQVKDTEMR